MFVQFDSTNDFPTDWPPPPPGAVLFYPGQPDLLLVQMSDPGRLVRTALFCLVGRQGVDQIPPPGRALPQVSQIPDRPVVGRKQVVEQAQFPVRAVLQAFFTSLIVVLR